MTMPNQPVVGRMRFRRRSGSEPVRRHPDVAGSDPPEQRTAAADPTPRQPPSRALKTVAPPDLLERELRPGSATGRQHGGYPAGDTTPQGSGGEREGARWASS
jgi:hypothetical protein